MNLFRDVNEKIAKIVVPKWFPELLKKEVKEKGSISLSCQFTKGERKIYRKEKFMWPSEWAEKHRIVTNSSMPGPWKNKNTPYLAGIMDAAAYSFVNEVDCRKCSQSGVTEAAINFLGYVTDRDPGPAMFVFADENTTKDNSKDRIQPMFRSSTRLQQYRTGYSDDESDTRINLNHMTIYLAWASSSSRLANKPIRYGFTDEVDKPGYQKTKSQGETSGLNLFEKRMKTYKQLSRHTWWVFSTPTTEKGNISVKMEEAEVVFEYNVRCPDCGASHIMEFDNIKWNGGRKADPKEMEAKNLAWYECPSCSGRWDELKRNKAVFAGEWRDNKKGLELHTYLTKFRPSKVGFQLPAWITPFTTFSEIAAKWIRGLRDPDQMKDHYNDHRALPYTGAGHRTVEAIEKLKDFRPPRLVPGNNLVAGLTAGVDTQDDGFFFEIRAWGWGIERDSWQIRHGFVNTFSALEEVLWGDTYKDADGNEYMIQLTIQDAMGHKTSEVYDFCIKHRGLIFPFQGKQRLQRPFRFSPQEFFPGTNKPIPGGVQLLQADVTYYKNMLSRHLDILPDDPGEYRFHSETTEDWLKMLTAEYQDEHGLWQCPKGKPNHGWDCSVYSLIAADVLNMRYWEKEEEEEPEAEATAVNTVPQKWRRKKAW